MLLGFLLWFGSNVVIFSFLVLLLSLADVSLLYKIFLPCSVTLVCLLFSYVLNIWNLRRILFHLLCLELFHHDRVAESSGKFILDVLKLETDCCMVKEATSCRIWSKHWPRCRLLIVSPKSTVLSLAHLTSTVHVWLRRTHHILILAEDFRGLLLFCCFFSPDFLFDLFLMMFIAIDTGLKKIRHLVVFPLFVVFLLFINFLVFHLFDFVDLFGSFLGQFFIFYFLDGFGIKLIHRLLGYVLHILSGSHIILECLTKYLYCRWLHCIGSLQRIVSDLTHVEECTRSRSLRYLQLIVFPVSRWHMFLTFSMVKC